MHQRWSSFSRSGSITSMDAMNIQQSRFSTNYGVLKIRFDLFSKPILANALQATPFQTVNSPKNASEKREFNYPETNEKIVALGSRVSSCTSYLIAIIRCHQFMRRFL